MKFTKENVYKMVERYSVDQGYLIDDLKSDIFKLDDAPKKVVVPKFVADFCEGYENATIYYLIEQLMRYDRNSELGKWYKNCEGRHNNGRANAQEVIAKMELYGYEVEKEPLYEVIIAGRHLLKLFHGRIDHEFAEKTELCAWAKVAYQLTEQEIKAIDERYWPFAVPAND